MCLCIDRINCHQHLYLVSLFKLVLSDSSGYVYLYMISVCSRVIYDRVQNGKKDFNLVFNLLMPKKLMEINQILDHGILEDHKKGGLHPKSLVDICFEIKLFCNLYHLLQLAKRGKFTIIFTVPYPIIYITLASMS